MINHTTDFPEKVNFLNDTFKFNTINDTINKCKYTSIKIFSKILHKMLEEDSRIRCNIYQVKECLKWK